MQPCGRYENYYTDRDRRLNFVSVAWLNWTRKTPVGLAGVTRGQWNLFGIGTGNVRDRGNH